MLSIRDLLGELDITILAGEDNVGAPVRWVHISELADPTPWLSGGELLLTTGMGLETAREQRAYIKRLADHGLAGVGLGVGFRHKSVPKAMVAAAAERDFPLVEVPYDVPFIALTERAFGRLVNEQYAVLQRSIAAQERLQRIVLSERGLDALVAAIAALVGATVLVFDGRGELLARHTFRRELDDESVELIASELHGRARRGDARGFVPAHAELSARALALPVGAGGEDSADLVPQAWLVAVRDQGPPSAEFERLVLHQGVTAIALELLRGRIAESTERRLAGDVLAELVRGDVSGPELARRLEPFGLGARTAALVMRPTDRRRAEACEVALTAAVRDEALGGLVAIIGELVCALLPGLPDEELVELAGRVHARVSDALTDVPAAGVGRAVPLGRAREAYHEARCALEALALNVPGEQTEGSAVRERRIATYRDLGSFALLLSLQDTDALRLYCDSLLGPLEQGEGHYGGELVRSLEAFIECNGQWEAAARRLYCHRHTLRYRVRKIEELTGRDLSSARDRIEFWLALRGRDLTPDPQQARV